MPCCNHNSWISKYAEHLSDWKSPILSSYFHPSPQDAFPIIPEPPLSKVSVTISWLSGKAGRGWEGLDEGSSWLVALVGIRGLYRNTSLPTALVSLLGDARMQSSCGAL